MRFFDESPLPEIPLGDFLADVVDWVETNLGMILDFIDTVITLLVENLAEGLHWVPPIIMAVILAAIAWAMSGWRVALLTVIGMLFIQTLPTADMWKESLDTLALVLISALIAMVFAIPWGILAARNSTASKITRPIMDFMQTMPPFVYLIPTLFFFSIGIVPGVVSTIVFCMPPGVRLTELGIRQVDAEMVEAGHAFGAPPRQILTRIQIPLAMPTIMAGINQLIMLSLSMVVIAGIVGAGGLGGIVLEGVNRLDLAKGFEGGVAVVVIAIYLDRVTAGFSKRSAVARAAAATER